MRQGFRILPVYTGDVSGAASALYELGGMCVIHDPSGCNSTYNTHDETRWYDHDSLIFISALNDVDAIMGNDQKLVEDIVEAAFAYQPAFIALMNSPIPFIMGQDFDALCMMIEEQTGIPTFYVQTNAMHDYVRGAGLAWKKLAEKMIFGTDDKAIREEADEIFAEQGKNRVNVLGMTPLDFSDADAVCEMKAWLATQGWNLQACWAMENEEKDLLQELFLSRQADLNVVVSSTGLEVAELLWNKAGIPYVAGVPTGAFADVLHQKMKLAVQEHRNIVGYAGTMRAADHLRETRLADRVCDEERRVVDSVSDGTAEVFVFIGEAVSAGSKAAQARLEKGVSTIVLCATEDGEKLMGENSEEEKYQNVWGEEEVQQALEMIYEEAKLDGKSMNVIADPLYQPIIPKGCTFTPLPHFAFSGRIYK